MKRFSFVLGLILVLSASADVTISDIWRWGIVRRSDVLPPGVTVTLGTDDVWRVVERSMVEDVSRVVVTVVTNIESGSYFLPVGRYVSGTRSEISGGWIYAVSNWVFYTDSYAATNQMQVLSPDDHSVYFYSTNNHDSLPCSIYGGGGAVQVDWNSVQVATTNEFMCGSLPWQSLVATGELVVTNLFERPVSVSGTGTLSVAFSCLRGPALPVTLLLYGYDSVAWPTNTYFVGGGSWQTNRVNHFLVWESFTGTELFALPLTTSELP